MALTTQAGAPGGTPRELEQVVSGVPSFDGDGVKLTRFIGTPDLNMVDPFLLLDWFESDHASGPIGGFPSHPHRGFQTVTYMLAGRMRHKDNAAHESVIEPGGVQWMNAGRGIIHSEMPEREEGRMSGFQLWVNLPAADKMSAPSYQEFAAAELPTERLQPGIGVKVIAGTTDRGTTGPVQIPATEPLYFDVDLDANAAFTQRIPEGHGCFIYVIDGIVSVGTDGRKLSQEHLGVLGSGDKIEISNGGTSSRFLLIAGRQLKEPVARGGPFVMNTEHEVRQAFQDYRSGRF